MATSAFFLVPILAIVLFSFPAWIFFRSRVHWYIWDYGVPIYGVIIWFLMEYLRIGRDLASLSNFVVEIFWILVASIISIWLRVIFPGKENKTSRISSTVSVLIPIVIAIILRLTMPWLPE
jgi:hypothetical protein